MARKFKKGDTIQGLRTGRIATVIRPEGKGGSRTIGLRYDGKEHETVGLASSYRLMKKRPSKKDRRIAELVEQLADKTKQANEHAEDAIKKERESVAAQYAEDQRLLTGGLVRIDFLRNIMERGVVQSNSDGVKRYFSIAERNGRGNGALLSAFLKELKK